MAHNEGATTLLNVKQLQFADGGEASPTVNLSGNVYMSGNGLMFKQGTTITPLVAEV